jgi:hypothetical protein
MRLHCDVGIQVVKGSIGLLATLPAALVHALDFFIASSGTLVLLRTRDWHERIDGRELRALKIVSSQSLVDSFALRESRCTGALGEGFTGETSPAEGGPDVVGWP